MDKIYISAPVAGNSEINKAAVEWLCKKAVSQGHAPFAPTLLYENLLKHQHSPIRAVGIACSLAWLPCCQQLWVYGSQGIRPRMRREIETAKTYGLKLVMFTKGQA